MALSSSGDSLRVCSLFSGIGGFELGLSVAGHSAVFFCESDPFARTVLADHFPGVEVAADVRKLRTLPACDLVTAGWPCQDLSLAGGTKGIRGSRSRLVAEVFRLIEASKSRPQFVLLENVPFALDLQKGRAVGYVLDRLEALGYRWAYRILDTRAFGLPQRRRRLFVLGALDVDPAKVLLDGIGGEELDVFAEPEMVGFYWTEGTRGLGWSPESVPPLKGGSGLGIPSPPAIWHRPSGMFIAPSIEDAERLQGFPSGWTSAAAKLPRGERRRWVLVGNAVSVPVAEWIGSRLAMAEDCSAVSEVLLMVRSQSFARAGAGGPELKPARFAGRREGPLRSIYKRLNDFELLSPSRLSRRAIGGFTSRFEVAPLRKDPDFLKALRAWAVSELSLP